MERDRDSWTAAHVTPAGPAELVSERPWATVLRVPVAGGAVWFKACGPVQAFEPRPTAALATRSELLPRVVAVDEERAWLLLADAGSPLTAFGDRLDAWLALLPRYAELQTQRSPRSRRSVPSSTHGGVAPTIQHDDLHGASV